MPSAWPHQTQGCIDSAQRASLYLCPSVHSQGECPCTCEVGIFSQPVPVRRVEKDLPEGQTCSQTAGKLVGTIRDCR
jgi:hypothetical protein